jgi:hypothetical protein
MEGSLDGIPFNCSALLCSALLRPTVLSSAQFSLGLGRERAAAAVGTVTVTVIVIVIGCG